MFGNKHGGDEIAKEFLKILEASQKDQNNGGESPQALVSKAQVDAADFLVSPAETHDESGDYLEEKISEVDSYAHDAFDGGMCAEDDGAEEEEEVMLADDFQISISAKTVLEGLGKIAGNLRGKGENFAADMVEATALGISKDLASEASRKLFVTKRLREIEASFGDDAFAADMVKAAINKIKRS